MRPGNPMSMPAGASMGAGLRPFLTGYSVAGVANGGDYYAGTTLTIPLDGRVYDLDFPAENITIAFSGAPTAPVCADTVINFKQRTSGTMYGFTAWPIGIKWASGAAPTMTQTLSARLKVVISTQPSGLIDASSTPMGI